MNHRHYTKREPCAVASRLCRWLERAGWKGVATFKWEDARAIGRMYPVVTMTMRQGKAQRRWRIVGEPSTQTWLFSR